MPLPTHATPPVLTITAACYPDYPPPALRAGAEGMTRLRYTVDSRGHVTGGFVLGRSGKTHQHEMLDKAAFNALRTCQVRPAVDANGHPTASSVDVVFDWRLDGGTPRPDGVIAHDATIDTKREEAPCSAACVAVSNAAILAWRQSDASYEAAYRNQSTSPSYVMVTVIDENTGSAQLTCTEANFILGAIHFDRGIPFDRVGSERVRQMALANKSHRFEFHAAKALQNVSRHYTDSELAKVNIALRAKSVSQIMEAQQYDLSLRRLVGGDPGYDGFQDVIACILIARGESPRMADMTGQLVL